MQYFHRINGAGQLGEPYVYQATGVPFETKLNNIVGELHLDVANVMIEALDIEAKTTVKNRFGSTRFYQAKARTNGGCDIYSSSGDIRFFLSEEALGTFNINARTFCGRINYSGLRNSENHMWNNTEEVYVGTLPVDKSDKAEVRLRSDAGEIQIETIPTG